MQGVNVFENGMGYLLKCLGLYTGGTGFFAMYLIAVLIVLIKGTQKDRDIFLPQAVMLALTVYNPLTPLILDKIFDVSSEYYRLFWIAPVIILVPYTATLLVTQRKAGWENLVMALLIVVMFVAGGNYVYAEGYDTAENIYKIPNELIEISQLIHEDCDTEYTKAFFEYEYNMEIRQFDPKMLLCVDREDYIYAVNYSYTQDMLADGTRPQNRLLALFVRNQKIEEDDLIASLEATATEYVVLTKGHPQAAFAVNAGLHQIAETATHIIYKYDLEEPFEYELVDYKDVEHRFSYRRLK